MMNAPSVVSSSQINLSWSAASDAESGIQNYKLYYCSGSTSCSPSTLITLGNQTSYNHTGLSANTLYRYQVSAVNGTGLEGSRSSIVSATTQSSSTSGTTYYVATTGSDSNSCTATRNLSTPKRTITAGMTCLASGDTLEVKGGTYNENLVINVPSGTAGAYTTIQAAEGETVWLRPTTFTASPSFPYQRMMHMGFGGQHHVKIERINMDGSGYPDTDIYSVSGIMTAGLTNNSTPTHSLIFDGIEIKNTRGDAMHMRDGTYNSIFRNMHIHSIGPSVADTSGAGGIYWQSSSGTPGNLLEYSLIESGDAAIGMADASNAIIRRNIFRTSIGPSIYIRPGTQNLLYINNLIIDNSAGIYITNPGAITGVKIFNNTIYKTTNTGGGGVWGACIRIGSDGLARLSESVASIKNNICSETQGPSTTNVSGNLYAADAKFVNAAGGDFHLQSTSPAIDTGITLAEVTSDFDGVSRPQGSAYDMGGYEFTSAADTTPPSAPSNLSTTAVSSSQINLSWTAATDGQSAITNYKIYRCTGSSCTPTTLIATIGNTTSYQNTGLAASTAYRYAVSAVSGGGEGQKSNTATATTQSSSTSGTTYYVATTGSDSNSCTAARNLSTAKRTITAGMTCLASGDTLEVKGGTYNENLVINVPSGTASAYTTIRAATGEAVWLRPTIYYSSTDPYHRTIRMHSGGQHHIKIERINVDLTGLPVDGVHSTEGVHTQGVSNSNTPTHHLIYEGIEIKGSRGDASHIRMTYGTIFRNMHIHDVRPSVADTSPASNIYFQSNTSGTEGNIVENSILGSNNDNEGGLGISMIGANDPIVRNTLITGNAGNACIVFREGTANALFYNNICAKTNSGIVILSTSSNVKVYNNTIHGLTNTGNNGIWGSCLRSSGTTALSSNQAALVKNNICWQTQGPTTFHVAGNLYTDPQFVSINSDDYHLESTSPAINAGITLAEVTTDFDSVSRPQGSAYDMGAYEYCSGGSCGGGMPATQSPYLGSPISLPGTIQAEHYDLGGEGVAYHDTTSGNAGNQFRTDNVDIQTTTDTGGGYNIGYVTAGEWLEYTVSVPTTGTYGIETRVASQGSGGTFHYTLDGASITSAQTVPDTGSWQSFQTLSATAMLSQGTHILRLYFDTNGATGSVGNINWIRAATPSIATFNQSDRIQTNTSGSTVNVRSCASTSCSILGTQPDRALGTITSGSPTTADGFTWHQIDFASGADGFVAESFLVFAGDLNRDNTVNSLDWSMMNSAWFTADTTAGINKDGLVNSIDFGIMNRNWGASSS
jgi:fibronectin type 3 domain-containing protein